MIQLSNETGRQASCLCLQRIIPRGLQQDPCTCRVLRENGPSRKQEPFLLLRMKCHALLRVKAGRPGNLAPALGAVGLGWGHWAYNGILPPGEFNLQRGHLGQCCLVLSVGAPHTLQRWAALRYQGACRDASSIETSTPNAASQHSPFT